MQYTEIADEIIANATALNDEANARERGRSRRCPATAVRLSPLAPHLDPVTANAHAPPRLPGGQVAQRYLVARLGCQIASPRKTRSARLSRMRTWSDKRPTGLVRLVRGTVATLSTISRLVCVRPVVSDGCTGIRSRGASTSLVVNCTTVTEAVASNRSSWMTTTGGGFPL